MNNYVESEYVVTDVVKEHDGSGDNVKCVLTN